MIIISHGDGETIYDFKRYIFAVRYLIGT